MQTPAATLKTFLHQNELRHITPLKVLGLFGEQLRAVPLRVADEVAYLLWSQRDVSQYDNAKYPSADVVFYPALDVAPSAAMLEVCARAILNEACGRTFVVKTIEPPLIAALRTLAPIARFTYERALCTFTVTPDASATASRAMASERNIDVTSVISDAARPLLDAHNVYSAGELETMFADGSGRCFVSFDGDVAVGVALSFPNSSSLYEIGSLYVAPAARRAGHASALVRAALADVAARGLAVRYVVDATNAPSIALAERCGLREVMRLEHWLVAGS